MRALIAIACLGLVAWEPARAETTYTVTVSRHASVRDFSEKEVKQILRKASTVLHNAGCDVTFRLDGPIRTFSSPNVPSDVVSTSDLDQVHGEPADVKIVKGLHCCVERKGIFGGCSWPPKAGSRSIILTEGGATLGNRWAHEFGHRMGLPHRGKNTVLMTKTGVTAASVRLNKAECRCYLNQGSCTLPPQPMPAAEDKCPQ